MGANTSRHEEKSPELPRCPACGGNINLATVSAEEGIEILSGELQCASCAKSFPIVRGVPRFAELPEVEEEKRATADSFGWSWQQFSHDDERYEQQFLDWIAPVRPEFVAGKIVLEGGCGKGRHTQRMSRWGAKDVVAVDLSAAVEVAFAGRAGKPGREKRACGQGRQVISSAATSACSDTTSSVGSAECITGRISARRI